MERSSATVDGAALATAADMPELAPAHRDELARAAAAMAKHAARLPKDFSPAEEPAVALRLRERGDRRP